MKIKSITLKNYRGFEEVTIDLARPLTVLAGVNGSGKSTVLDALACLVSRLYRTVYQSRSDGFGEVRDRPEDIRVGASELSIQAKAEHEDHDLELSIALNVRGRRNAKPGRGDQPSLPSFKHNPLAVYYGVARVAYRGEDAFEPDPDRPLPAAAKVAIRANSLVAGSDGFRSLFRWYKEREDVENEQKVERNDLAFMDPLLGAIRDAVAAMLPGFSGLRVQRDPLHLMVRKGATTLYLDQLSEGERGLLVMVADLARRLAVAYPDLQSPLQGEAVVLIDEVELHLHPAWQRMVVGALLRTFPNCQFIVTTHSPQVLGEVPGDAVVLVKDFQAWRPPAPTEGRDANAILWEVLGVTAHPAAVAAALDGIGELIDGGRYGEARASLDRIAEKLTERDPEVLALRSALDLTERLDAGTGQEPAA